MTRTAASLVAIVLVSACATPASALQSLLPQPYPSEVPGATPLDPLPQGIGEPQTIMQDPYPQVTGDTSQGNPPIVTRRGRRHQRLVPSLYRRKYRVDRH